MTDFVLYARHEPTSDEFVREAIRQSPQPRKLKPAYDTVFYKDRDCKQFYARYPWHYRKIGSKKELMLNCVKWRLEWLPPLEISEDMLELGHLLLKFKRPAEVLARFVPGRRAAINLIRNSLRRKCLEMLTGARVEYSAPAYTPSGRGAFGRAKGGERARKRNATFHVTWP